MNRQTAQSCAATLVRADHAENTGDRSRLSAAQTEILDRALTRVASGDATAIGAVTAILDHTVRMPLYRVEAAQAAIAALAAKARKRNLPEPAIEILSRETIGTGPTAEDWVTVRVIGAAPILNGWSCVAAIHAVHKDDGEIAAIVHTAHGETCPQSAVDAPTQCEHCHTNRKRVLTFVLRHENSQTCQVGSTCLNDYLGTDALGAWFVWSRLHATTAQWSGWGEYDRAEHDAHRAVHGDPRVRRDNTRNASIPLRDFLACVAAEIRTAGYVTRRESTAERPTTGPLVWRRYQTATHASPTSADYDAADGAIAWLDSFADEIAYDDRGDLTYRASLAAYYSAAVAPGVRESSAAMLASAIPAHAKQVAWDAQRAAENAAQARRAQGAPDHVVGRQSLEIRITNVIARPDWTMHKFEDRTGRAYLTFGKVPAGISRDGWTPITATAARAERDTYTGNMCAKLTYIKLA